MKARKGFTLMELLVVVLVLSTLAGIMVPRIIDFQKAGKRSNCKANIANQKKAIERYAVDNEGTYPTVINYVTEVVEDDKYFPHGAPVCPFDDAYVYALDDDGGTITDHDHSAD